jgi:hypothetical protein
MSVHASVIPRVARGRVGSRAWWAQGGGEVDRPRSAEHPDREVAQGRHDLRGGAGAELAGILGEGDVADVVQAVLDRPVPAEEVGEAGGAGLGEREAGDGVDDHRPPAAGVGLEVAGLAGTRRTWATYGKPTWVMVTALRVRNSTRP